MKNAYWMVYLHLFAQLNLFQEERYIFNLYLCRRTEELREITVRSMMSPLACIRKEKEVEGSVWGFDCDDKCNSCYDECLSGWKVEWKESLQLLFIFTVFICLLFVELVKKYEWTAYYLLGSCPSRDSQCKEKLMLVVVGVWCEVPTLRCSSFFDVGWKNNPNDSWGWYDMVEYRNIAEWNMLIQI